jgi:hypothetical protein
MKWSSSNMSENVLYIWVMLSEQFSRKKKKTKKETGEVNWNISKEHHIWLLKEHLVSCQNDRLSSWGMTKVAFIMCATATMSEICRKTRLLSLYRWNYSARIRL